MPYSATKLKAKTAVLMMEVIRADRYNDKIHRKMQKCFHYLTSESVVTVRQIREVYNIFISISSIQRGNFLARKKYSTTQLISIVNRYLNNDRELKYDLCMHGNIRQELARLMKTTIKTCFSAKGSSHKRERLIKCYHDLIHSSNVINAKTAESIFRRFVWHAAKHRHHGWFFGSTRRSEATTSVKFVIKYLNTNQILKDAFFPDAVVVTNELLQKEYNQMITDELLRGDIVFLSSLTQGKNPCRKTISWTSGSKQYHTSIICDEEANVIEANDPEIQISSLRDWLTDSIATIYRNKSRIAGETICEFAEMIHSQTEQSNKHYGQYSSHSRMLRAIMPGGILGRYNQRQFNNRNLPTDFYCSNFASRCILAAHQFYREFPPAESVQIIKNPIHADISPGQLKKALEKDPYWERVGMFDKINIDKVAPVANPDDQHPEAQGYALLMD
ncbi:hypothetical protein P0136_06140 [Lentisphaerota bacterium ZTH]|nr:hypothetical protein JYG24_02750 [Lentisphaerota bacterium]WET07569.1 hypothetical protein P0136_06140 [Lentisphaerota bacterium ZTH]